MKFSVVLAAALFLSAFVSAQVDPTGVSNPPDPATENPPPTTDNPPPTTDNPPPTTDNPPPTTDNPPPTTDNPPPTTDNPPPTTDNPSPTTDNPSPTTDNPSPTTDNPSSSSENPSLSAENPSSSTENLSSSTENPSSSSGDPSSSSGNPSSSSGNPSSSSGDPSSLSANPSSSSGIPSSATESYSSSSTEPYSESPTETYPSSPTETDTTSFGAGTETTPESPTKTNPESTAMPTTSAQYKIPTNNSTNINVEVAPGDQLTYSNTNFKAPNGTIVTFYFTSDSVSHSTTQGSFVNPCVYLTPSGGDPAGFDSGLQSDGKEFVLTIANDRIPVWFFCKNSDYCGLGMVGVINAPISGNTYDKWVAAAKALGSNEMPVVDDGPVTGGVGAVATSTPSPIPPALLTSSSTHLVANGFLALLAAAFGFAMTLT